MLVQIADCQQAKDWLGEVEVDLVGVDDDAAASALLLPAIADRMCSPRPRIQHKLSSTSSRGRAGRSPWHNGPWDERLMDRLFHPQLRMDPFQVNENWPLEQRR